MSTTPQSAILQTPRTTAFTLLSEKKLDVLYRLAVQTLMLHEGEVWECGVYKGGSAVLLAEAIRETEQPIALRLFDTFSGHPFPQQEGESSEKFADVDAGGLVRMFSAYENVTLHPGIVPETFAGLEDSRIRFAHLDMDLYPSTRDALTFIWPRMVRGGVVIVDDYGYPGWPGIKRAVDEFFTPGQLQRGEDTQVYAIKGTEE